MVTRSPEQQARERFASQRRSAVRKGCRFLLSFDQWFAIWRASGHFHERGRGRGKYCLARLDAGGAFEVGNVRVITIEAVGAARRFSDETRAKIAARNRRRRASAKTRAKMSAAQTARKAAQRMEALP